MQEKDEKVKSFGLLFFLILFQSWANNWRKNGDFSYRR